MSHWRRSWPSRLAATLLAAWFVVSIVAAPASLSDSGIAMAGMAMAGMNMPEVKTPTPVIAQDSAQQSDEAITPTSAQHGDRQNDSDSSHCKQHDCCCSALSPSLLTPQAVLSWIPEHVSAVLEERIVENVSHSDGQLLLPFANGPPLTVQL